MKTMDCSTLELLIKNHEPIDLIDVRAPEEFAASHIPGARSVPFAKLPTRKIFRRPQPQAERIYVISDDQGSASLAAGILRSESWSDPVIVEGGMKAWLAKGFPVRRAVPFKLPTVLRVLAILSGIAALLALTWHQTLIAALLCVIATALVLKANLLTLVQGRESETADRADNDKVLPEASGIGFMQAAHS
jgi:rhodanese-related sulfurtransferase